MPRSALERSNIEVTLDQACGSGVFTLLARIALTTALDPERDRDVSFDPVLNAAPGLNLYPRWLADLRARAYQHSRDGRDAEE